MKIQDRGRRALCCVTFTLVGGCGGSQAPSVAPVAPLPNSVRTWEVSSDRLAFSEANYRILHDFKGQPDGANPYATLLAVNGTLYGTTSAGGAQNQGAVFAENSSGKERVLYSFKGKPDGSAPLAGLLEIDGRLYGTTMAGGAYGWGTVFEITPSGKERVLYSFQGAPDGGHPWASVIAVKGVLYGTTTSGGIYTCTPSSSGPYGGCGVVFKLTLSGKESVLHRFKNGRRDGGQPFAPLVALGDDLYGTASVGGTHDAGVVYEISESGKEHLVYSFKGSPDGAYPTAGLLPIRGTFFGTTEAGGTGPNSGGGTFFKISSHDEERVLYRFSSGGTLPWSGVIAVNETFYGTTLTGGGIYEVTGSGREKVLQYLPGHPNGKVPFGGLTFSNGALYGTTSEGGTDGGSEGDGIVFKLTLRR